MKKLFILTTIMLSACSFFPDKDIYVTSLTPEWTSGITATSSGKVVNFLTSTINPKDSRTSGRIYVAVDLTLQVVDGKYDMCRKAREREKDRIPIQFWFGGYERKEYTYKYDSSKVWLMSANGIKHHLQQTEHYSSKKLPYKIYNQAEMLSPQRTLYFKNPLLCEQLEGAVFELRGFYEDGKELPPIIFRINHVK